MGCKITAAAAIPTSATHRGVRKPSVASLIVFSRLATRGIAMAKHRTLAYSAVQWSVLLSGLTFSVGRLKTIAGNTAWGLQASTSTGRRRVDSTYKTARRADTCGPY